MLRNNSKIAIGGLIYFLAGCSNTSILLQDSDPGVVRFDDLPSNFKISGDLVYQNKMRFYIRKSLERYFDRLKKYKIRIKIDEQNGVAAYSQTRILKEQKRIFAHIEVLDERYETVLLQKIDSFSSFEVMDDLPFASISSENNAKNLMIEDISQNISLVLIELCGKP